MGLRAGHVILDAQDFRLQRLDAGLQFLDRHRVEVLLGKLDQRIAGLAWEEVFQIHAGIVDRSRPQVNKPDGG